MRYNFKTNGWISDDGVFYGCRWANHHALLHKICKQKGLNIFDTETKWLKISDDPNNGFSLYLCNQSPTQAQINTFHDWCIFYKTDHGWKYFKEYYLNNVR